MSRVVEHLQGYADWADRRRGLLDQVVVDLAQKAVAPCQRVRIPAVSGWGIDARGLHVGTRRNRAAVHLLERM